MAFDLDEGSMGPVFLPVLGCYHASYQLPFHKWRTPIDRQGQLQRTTSRTQYCWTRSQPTLLEVKKKTTYLLLYYSLVLRRAVKHKRVSWADIRQECRVRNTDIRGVQLLTVAGCHGPQPMVWAGSRASRKNFPMWYT